MIRRPPRSTRSRGGDEAPVAGLERCGEPRARVAALDQRPSRVAQSLARGGLPEQARDRVGQGRGVTRSEEHTSELQSRPHLVCRLLLEKKKRQTTYDRDCKTHDRICAPSDVI